MVNIILTESQVRTVLKKILKEQVSTPVIDFNKLPAVITLNDNASDEALYNAGFPRSIKDPIRNNSNVLRYYTQEVSDSGNYVYKKKLKAPTPNYVVNTQEKTVPKGKYDNGFLGKFGCVIKQGWREGDANKDGIVDYISRGSTNEEVRYYPNGKSKIFRGAPPKPHWEDSTWYCSGNKVVDSFLKNTAFKPYKDNNPWVNQGGVIRIALNTTDNGSNGNIIAGIQQKLIDLGLLKIRRPTGNYGVMTKKAIEDYAAKNNPTQYTNQTAGITKDVYDQLMKTTKTFGK